MVAASPSLRTRMWTWRASPDRNTAAWPALLPPPTTITSSFAHRFPSIQVAA
jgi:hypothetical protein